MYYVLFYILLQLQRDFPEIGYFQMTVNASNALGSMQDTMDIIVQEPISRVSLCARPGILGEAMNVSITVDGGLDFYFDIDYGDGNHSLLIATKTSGSNITVVTSEGRQGNNITRHRFSIQYLYREVSEYEMTVNVSNEVSWLGQSRRLFLEEPLAGLQIFATMGDIIPTGRPVTVVATVQSGNDLTYDFDFQENSIQNAPK